MILKDKRGFYNQIAIVILMGFILGMLVIFAYAAMLFFPLIANFGGDLTGIITDATSEANTGDQALENATQSTFVQVNRGVQQLEWISFAIYIFLILTMLIMCFYVRTYPFLAFVWILIILVIVFMAIFLANVYQDIRIGELGDAYTSWENQDFYLRYLPQIVFIIGIIGGIIMFVLASRQPEAEGVYI